MASEIRLTLKPDSAARLSPQHQDIMSFARLCLAAKGICSLERNPHLFQRKHLLHAKPSARGFTVPLSVNSQNNLVPFPHFADEETDL